MTDQKTKLDNMTPTPDTPPASPVAPVASPPSGKKETVTRSFKVTRVLNHETQEEIAFKTGRYVSSTPSSAAQKSSTQIRHALLKAGLTAPDVMDIHLKETTRDRKSAVYAYTVTRKVNDVQKEVFVAQRSKPIVFKFVNTVKALPKAKVAAA